MSAGRLLLCHLLLGHAAQAANDPADFASDARLIYRVAACAGGDSLPSSVDAKVVKAHCEEVSDEVTSYRHGWLDQAAPFLAKLRPASLPSEVVYPFGGADLTTALATFPDASTITTISLEHSGDARQLAKLPPKQLEWNLEQQRMNMRQLLRGAYSATVALDALSETELTAELFSDELALSIHGYEPVSLRYFTIATDGSLHYVTAEEIAAAERADAAAPPPPPASKNSAVHHTTNDLSIFQDVEIRFRKLGDLSAPVKTFRHVAFNLDDDHLAADPSLLAHLAAKGKVAAMTKAASFLLWGPKFSTIRKYLLEHMTWMISDASGIPPADAAAAGFEEITYGDFQDPLFEDNTTPELRSEMAKLWTSQKHRDLPFRFGYPDKAKKAHLMIARPR